jgi:thiol-disulfide isomerase/thioredoxin
VSVEPIDAAGVKRLVKNDSNNLRLINVWATWCAPCVEELPELVTINRMYRKRRFEMMTISVDNPEDRDLVLKQLQQLHVSSTNYLYNSTDRDAFAEALDKEWPGPVPYTILVAPGGKIIFRKHDKFDPLELKKAIIEQLGRTYASR